MTFYEYEEMMRKQEIEESAKRAKQNICHHDGVVAILKEGVYYNDIESARCMCFECDGTFDVALTDILSRGVRVYNKSDYEKAKDMYFRLRELETPTHEIASYINRHLNKMKCR